ncbi:MAG: hypothetical protein ACLQUY_21985 [Ktedonobacterales bacterium]
MQRPGKPGAQYPTVRYHWTKDAVIVNNAEEEAALGGGWADTPAAFEAYGGPRPARTAGQNAIQWVDDWPLPGVTSDDRQRIKIELLRADAEFWRSPDTHLAPLITMRRAFDGIARVLSVAGVLTESLLRKYRSWCGIRRSPRVGGGVLPRRPKGSFLNGWATRPGAMSESIGSDYFTMKRRSGVRLPAVSAVQH